MKHFICIVLLLATTELSQAKDTREEFLKIIDRPRVALNPEAHELTGTNGISIVEFSFASDSKQRVPGILLKKTTLHGRQPAVIVMHGTGGRKEDELPLLRRLADVGFVAIAIDGRYHGARTKAGHGAVEYQQAIVEAWNGSGEHPFYYDTVWDITRLYDYLGTRDDVDASRIGLTGISKGGIETYLTASIEPRVAVAVPIIGMQSFHWALENNDWGGRIATIQDAFNTIAKEEQIPKPDSAFVQRFYDRIIPGIYSSFDGPALIPLIAPRPLLIINSDGDKNTPLPGVNECVAAARKAYETTPADLGVVIQTNSVHQVRPTSEQAMIDWFVRWLKPASQGAAQLQPGQFQNPINSAADPYMEFYEDNYYLTTTQGDAIRMWKSPTLRGLKTAKPVTVWIDTDTNRCRGIWAPEFHFITNHWYMYYTATSADGNDANHRLYVLESEGKDPLGPYKYKARLVNPANDQYAIDATVFQNSGDGLWYCVWAAQPGHVLNIAHMANPWTLASDTVVLTASGFGCDEVREGPQVLQRNGKLFLIYSACDTGKPDYKLGMLIAQCNSDLVDPHSWTQYPTPVFQRSDRNGVFGPGHNGFFRSPNGTEDWIVYHAKTTDVYTYKARQTRVQKFSWNSDGTPNFGEPLPLSAVLDEPSSKSVSTGGSPLL